MATISRTELDHRSDDFADVTLVWITGEGVDETVVCVRAKAEGTYFEIATEAHSALEVFAHPFVYRDFSSVAIGNDRFAA